MKWLLLLLSIATSATAKPYAGPLGVPWGKSPADARSILQTRLTFVEEKPGEEGPYDTIDQRWTGEFAKMKTAELLLRFHKGEFFYMTVTLGTVDAGSAAAVFESVVRKMKRAYGKPVVHKPAPKLSSKKAILDNVPLENRGWVLPMLWNEAKKGDTKDTAQDGALKDLMIRINLWDPFAGWSFSNKVKVQTFVFQYRPEGSDPTLPATLKPMWIFAKDDAFKEWKKAVRASKVVEPRDY